MSITVVSASPTPAPATAPNGGGDAAGQDFANLLQGQLITNAAQTVAAAPSDAPITDAALLLASLGLALASADAEPIDTAPTEAAPGDTAPIDAAASMLAALGLIAPQIATDASQQPPGKADKSAPLAALSETRGAEIKTLSQPLTTQPGLTTAPTVDDQAAKFAVAMENPGKVVTAETIATDAPASGITSPSSNMQVNANQLAANHNSALSVATPVRDQNWASDFGQKIVWLAGNDKQSAQLTLNPPQMGPIEISLNVDKGNASVSFASANAEVRDAIETALPRLREMFASAGIELGQTNVGAESFSQQQAANGERPPSSSRWTSDNAILGADTIGALQTRGGALQQGTGMVDIFA